MAVAENAKLATVEEYLARERQSETRSEFIAGRIEPMTGASTSHNRIVGDLFGELRNQLKGHRCECFASDMRVRIAAADRLTYPDVVVACPPLEFDDEHADTLLNPVIIVEVLSPSTEAEDRGRKFAAYRQLPSLREYVLVAQDRVHVERYERQGEQWALTDYVRREDVLPLVAVDCHVPLAEIYRRVDLPGAGQCPT